MLPDDLASDESAVRAFETATLRRAAGVDVVTSSPGASRPRMLSRVEVLERELAALEAETERLRRDGAALESENGERRLLLDLMALDEHGELTAEERERLADLRRRYDG